MVSYIKTQWFNLVVGFVNLVLATYYAIQEDWVTALCWFLYGCIWLVMSRIDYNHDRIKLLEAKAKKYDALVEKVDALQELLETERKYSDHLNKRIDSLVYIVEEMKRGNKV